VYNEGKQLGLLQFRRSLEVLVSYSPWLQRGKYVILMMSIFRCAHFFILALPISM